MTTEAFAFLESALESDPQDYGLPFTIWTIRDLQALLAEKLDLHVCADTVYRAVRKLGFKHGRPRHDLTHSQDRNAVASTHRVLRWLGEKPCFTRRTPSSLSR